MSRNFLEDRIIDTPHPAGLGRRRYARCLSPDHVTAAEREARVRNEIGLAHWLLA